MSVLVTGMVVHVDRAGTWAVVCFHGDDVAVRDPAAVVDVG